MIVSRPLSFRSVLIFVIVGINSCVFPTTRTTTMSSVENSNYSCDINTGVCELGVGINEQKIKREISNNKIKILYYYDALCGWCYGFSAVMKQLQNEYGDRIDIEVVSGGLFLGNRAGFVNMVAPHIKSGAYKSVESLTGVEFGDPFLKDVFSEGKMILNSLPPTIALCIVKDKFPDKELEFAALLLKAVYYDGINPVDIEAYGAYAEVVGFNVEEFNAKFNEGKYKKMAEEEFEKFRKSQYSGMPSLTVLKDSKEIPISNGYINYNQLKNRLGQFID